MTFSKPVVSAVLQPVTTVLDVLGGSVSLDVSRWPHVQGSLRVAAQPGLWETIDPRAAAQRVVVTCGDEAVPVTRTFDLALRRASRTAENEITVELASDEALLEDSAPAGDIRPWDALNYEYGYTAGGVARMVLDEIGATVADPSPNPSLIPYWELTNHIVNPRFQSTTKGAAASNGTSALASTSWTAAGSGSRTALRFTCATGGGQAVVAGFDPDAGTLTALRVTPGEWVSISVDVSCAAPNRGRRLSLAFHNQGSGVTQEYSFPWKSATDSQWVTLSGVMQVPTAAAFMSVRVVGDTISSGADQRMFVTNVCYVNWDDTIIPFHGSSVSPDYTFIWEGDVDDSPSTRFPVIERDPGALVRRAGAGGMDFLAPLLQSVGLRIVCDENRVWTLRNDTYTAPGSTTLAEGVNLGDYNLENGLDGWCDAATVHYEWIRAGSRLEQDDTYEAATPPRKRIRRVLNMPYPGPGRAENIVRRAQTGGRVARATARTDWGATAEQHLTITATVGPATTVLDGTIGAVTFNLDDNTMNVTARRQEDS